MTTCSIAECENQTSSPYGVCLMAHPSEGTGPRIAYDRVRRQGKSFPGDAARGARARVARREWLNAIKMASGCVDCGYRKHPAALEFDHVRGEKLFNIGEKLGHSRKLLEAEIAKCEIRCANCHAERTAERRAPNGSL